MNIYVTIGIIGIISGLICALADVPLVKPGKAETQKLQHGRISLWWGEVPESRFTLSFWLSFLGQPGTYLTMWMLAELITVNNPALGMALKINTFVGAYTGLLCHVVFCQKPMLYQRLHGKLGIEDAENALKGLDKTTMVPMVLGFLSLYLGTTIMVSVAILTGALNVPKLFILLNPIVSTIVLMALKKCGVKIIGPLGVGFSMFAIVLLVAGMGV